MKDIMCAVLAVVLIGCASAGEPSLVNDRELSLGGITIGDTESEVLLMLGKPSSTTDTGDFLNIRLDYPGLTVWLGEGRRVGEVLSTSEEHCTPGGTCPGMPFAKVKKKFGPPLVAEREDGTYMEYTGSESACWLQIAVNSGLVKSVRAECQP